MATLVLFYVVLLLALGTTALFFYGAWILLSHPRTIRTQIRRIAEALHLVREEKNPLLTPQHDWEAQGVLNPAAVEIDGVTHLFYRAIGADGVSRLGYASSTNGRNFTRLPYPVFALSGESPEDASLRHERELLHPGLVASGGSWAGVEDPRAVVIDGKVYVTFSAFGGWDSLRMGVTSLTVDQLKQRKWSWTPPIYLSPRGQVHKNWVLFPEKIRGKFAILHSLHTGSRDRVLVDYLDSLEQPPPTPIDSPYNPVNQEGVWDSRLRGAGPPPIRTPLGWLFLYHAIDKREPWKYKLGAMLLDLHDPTRVLHHSKAPVLEPNAPYENEGAKEGIVYACGATTKHDELTVFYGGADNVVCSARHSLQKLLQLLTAQPQLAYATVPVVNIPVVR
jgi:predicted GH43/DUF377 family glycosyl hydrolase